MPQWQPAIQPALRRRAHVKVIINNKDLTDIYNPYLISVKVISKDSGPDTCDIELDDRNAELPIPPRDSKIRVEMGWENSPPQLPLNEHVTRIYRAVMGTDLPDYFKDDLPWSASGFQIVFNGGRIDSVESGFSRRGGGRRLWIEAQSGSSTNKMKQPELSSTGAGNIGELTSAEDFLKSLLGKAGLNLQTIGDVGNIKRTFWAALNESPMHAAQRIANESGLSMKVYGDSVFIMPKNVTMGPSVEAVWGVNLISWRIKPFSGRAEWSGMRSNFFDNWTGLWKKVTGTIGGGTGSPFDIADAIAGAASAVPNEHVGSQANNASDTDSQEGRGTGFCIINGEPAAVAKGHVIIIGARPGVDGTYGIKEAEHNWSRSSGYTTRIDVKKPQLDKNVYATFDQRWNSMFDKLPLLPSVKDWPPGIPQPIEP